MPARRKRLVTRKGLERRTELARGALPKQGRAKQTVIPKDNGREGDWSPEVRAAVWARSGGMCEIQAPGCVGRSPGAEIEVHHRKLRRHGDHRLENAIAACRWNCHPVIHQVVYPSGEDGERRTAYRYGWLVRPGDDPAEIPWLRRGSEYGSEAPFLLARQTDNLTSSLRPTNRSQP